MKRLLQTTAMSLALGLGLCALSAQAKASAAVIPEPAAILAEQTAASHSSSDTELILEIVNFILLLAVLGYFLRKPAKDFFDQRSASTRQKLEEGAKALEAARARLAEVEGKLSGLEQEIAQLKAASEKDMQIELRRIRQETSEELTRIQQFAQTQISGAVRAAKSELKQFTGREAIEQARNTIAGRMDGASQRNLVKMFLSSLRLPASRN